MLLHWTAGGSRVEVSFGKTEWKGNNDIFVRRVCMTLVTNLEGWILSIQFVIWIMHHITQTIITVPRRFWGHCVNSEVIVLDQGISTFPQKNTEPHNDQKVDSAKLFLLLIPTLETFLMHFRCNFMKEYFNELISHSLFTYPCERISISPGVMIIV